MYVCICNAIREADLRLEARATVGGAEAVYAALGKRPNCGQCLLRAETVLAEERCAPVSSMLAKRLQHAIG